MADNYDSVRCVIRDFHVIKGEMRPYPENRFGYVFGGSSVFQTGAMHMLSSPNYMFCPGAKYRIKLRCLDPVTMEKYAEMIMTSGRSPDEIVERTVVKIPEQEDEDIEAEQIWA